jgi:hypothetical protein
VKRRILDLSPSFDETELGFPKFSRFLSQAEEHGIVRLGRGEGNALEVTLAGAPGASDAPPPIGVPAPAPTGARPEDAPVVPGAWPVGPEYGEPEPWDEPTTAPEPLVVDLRPEDALDSGLRLGPRGGSTRRRGEDEPPPVFAGQAAPVHRVASDTATAGSMDGLGLPSEPDAIVRYLTHRYKGVGEVTAQMLVDKYGAGLFVALRDDPQAVASIIPAGRGEQLIEAWKADFDRRTQLRDGGGNGNDRSEGRRRGGRARSRARPRE